MNSLNYHCNAVSLSLSLACLLAVHSWTVSFLFLSANHQRPSVRPQCVWPQQTQMANIWQSYQSWRHPSGLSVGGLLLLHPLYLSRTCAVWSSHHWTATRTSCTLLALALLRPSFPCHNVLIPSLDRRSSIHSSMCALMTRRTCFTVEHVYERVLGVSRIFSIYSLSLQPTIHENNAL